MLNFNIQQQYKWMAWISKSRKEISSVYIPGILLQLCLGCSNVVMVSSRTKLTQLGDTMVDIKSLQYLYLNSKCNELSLDIYFINQIFFHQQKKGVVQKCIKFRKCVIYPILNRSDPKFQMQTLDLLQFQAIFTKKIDRGCK
ncbi:Hypothetical_protein [Hexamita inflata]|uniref:Hypothetical_protein n=1 Tax=Hexamita inflata TaxID=28002 RepID=A0AA86T9L2_9EUKA|nr:Hypothetical protein HINF_LOCUS30 [Hexamita inflata]